MTDSEEWVQEILSRSQTLPIRIFTDIDPSSTTRRLTLARKVIQGESPRITGIEVRADSTQLLHDLFHDLTPPPFLKSLIIHDTGDFDPIHRGPMHLLQGHDTPHLQSLAVTWPFLEWSTSIIRPSLRRLDLYNANQFSELFWRQFPHPDVFELSILDLLDALKAMPLLEHVSLTTLFPMPLDDDDDLRFKIVSLPHLKHLRIVDSAMIFSQLLRNLRVPLNTTVQIDCLGVSSNFILQILRPLSILINNPCPSSSLPTQSTNTRAYRTLVFEASGAEFRLQAWTSLISPSSLEIPYSDRLRRYPPSLELKCVLSSEHGMQEMVRNACDLLPVTEVQTLQFFNFPEVDAELQQHILERMPLVLSG